MSGRLLLVTGATCGALALLGACSLGTASDDSAPAPTQTFSPPPPVGSVEHPRPVECVDGTTRIGSPMSTGRPAASPDPSGPGASPSSGGSAGQGAAGRPASEDVRIGPLVWPGLRGLETGDQHAHGVQNSGGWHYRLSPQLVPGAVVTVTIGAEQRARAGLEFGGSYDTTPTPAITFYSCSASATTFPGGFFVAGDGRACVPLDVRVGDAPAQHLVISFFEGRCPA